MTEGTAPSLTSFGAPLDGPLPLTPSQTVGPYLHIALEWPDGPNVVPAGTPDAITVGGVLLDGDGQPVPDGIIETWQADARGRFDHPDDPRGAQAVTPAGFRGFGRCTTDSSGHWHVVTVKPGPLPTPDGGTESPHLDVTVMARGMLDRVVTRLYFDDDDHAADPVIADVPESRRTTLIAARRANVPTTAPSGPDVDYRFDVHLQGDHETVFFDV
jgi:protocatechuate 3,4-dioxygenase alpha subunit